MKTGKQRATLEGHTGGVFSVAFSLGGMTLASGSDDKTIKLWDSKTGNEPYGSLVFSPVSRTAGRRNLKG
jgi:WD40 repeat protein